MIKPIISPDPPPPPPGAQPREELPTLPGEDEDAPTPRAPVERPSKPPPHAPSEQKKKALRRPTPPEGTPVVIDRAPPDRRPGRNHAGILGAGIVLLTR